MEVWRRGSLRGQHRRRRSGAFDYSVSIVRKDTGLDLVGCGSRAKLRVSCFAAERRRIANEWGAVDATKLQRFVSLSTIALGALLHGLTLFGETRFLEHFPKARVVTQWVHVGVHFHPGCVLIFCFERFVERGKRFIFLAQLCKESCHEVWI